MNGGADLGGMHGFGPVTAEPDEPVFHANWEARVFALTLAMGASGSWTLDQSRFARESLPPVQYLSSSYYEIWLAALERLLLERALVTPGEMESGRTETAPAALKRVLAARDVPAVLAAGAPSARPEDTEPAFRVGARVRVRNEHPTGHTRAPRYVRGRIGRITRVHGKHVFADASAAGAGEQPDWLYTVSFKAAELWGASTTAAAVHCDLWEPYLERP